MIYDTLENLSRYSGIAPEAVNALLKTLPEFSADAPAGKTVLIEDKLFILVQHNVTRNSCDGKIETHADFADLQMLVKGDELIGYADVSELETLEPYNKEGDYAFYAQCAGKTVLLPLKPGNFAIFFPGEGHMPGCGNGTEVVKIVVKIHKSLLTF